MQHYWPDDRRFAAESFGFQPIWLILQALEYGSKIHSEELHLQELGIATLSALFANANRDPKRGQPAAPKDFFYFHREEDSGPKLSAVVCEAFFSLVSDQILPAWVLGIAPIDRLRTCRKQGTRLIKPRAWVGDDLILILPKVEGKTVTAVMAINNGARGFVELRDVDSGTEFILNLSSESPEILWALEAEFEMFSHD